MEPTSNPSDWLDQVQTGRVPAALATRLRFKLQHLPREAARLEDELSLNAALESLPAAPVPSNFTARVMAEIEREEHRRERPILRWWPRLASLRYLGTASVAVLLAAMLGGWWQIRWHQRQDLAASVSDLAAVPGVEWLKDFDAIQLLRTPAQPGDVELIAALASP